MNRVERMRNALATASRNDAAIASGLAKAEWDEEAHPRGEDGKFGGSGGGKGGGGRDEKTGPERKGGGHPVSIEKMNRSDLERMAGHVWDEDQGGSLKDAKESTLRTFVKDNWNSIQEQRGGLQKDTKEVVKDMGRDRLEELAKNLWDEDQGGAVKDAPEKDLREFVADNIEQIMQSKKK